jgi:hypothetical protein
MLSPSELKAWYRRLNLNEPAQKLIDYVRSSEPARRVGGGRSNVSGLYPSRKMGVTIQFESHRVELAAIYAMEHDPLTLEFYDQPPSIILDYNSAKGKRLSVRHTPDFFVLRQDFAGWEEWKTEEDLNRLTEHNANRYRQEAGAWHCPPGECYAEQFGLSYRVRCAKEIDWRLQRNILFLHDYLHADPETIHGATRERILACMRVVPVISLADLIRQTAEFATPDDIYLLIASGRLYVDLYAEPLVEPAKVQVFQDRDAAIRHGAARPASAPLQNIDSGAVLTWDDRAWKVVNIGNTMVSLLGEGGTSVELPQSVVESLVHEGRLVLPNADRQEHHKLSGQLLQASEDDLKVANQRADIVRRHLSGAPPIEETRVCSDRLTRPSMRYAYPANGLGKGSEILRQSFEAATGNDLQPLTLSALQGSVSKLDIFRTTEAWCPGCLEQWRTEGVPIYSPLLWAVRLVAVCPAHAVPLVDRCPHCHSQFTPLRAAARPGYCSICSLWLGTFDLPLPKDSLDEQPNHLWSSTAVGQVLAAMPALQRMEPQVELIRNLQRCLEQSPGATRGYLANLAGAAG